MEPFALKVSALLFLGVVRLAAGLSPVAFANTLNGLGRRKVEVVSSLALCIAGGVLLASTMLHMIPKVRQDFAHLSLSFPAAELMVCCGLFVAYIIEEFVESVGRTSGVRSAEAELRINGKVAPAGQQDVPQDGNARHVLVLSALSLHSILEGLALGLQTNPKTVWLLAAAISGHAAVVLFCIGLDLVSEGLPEVQVVVFMIVLAASSPLGAFAALAATSGGDSHASAVAALQGLSAGAVMFVTFFEVLEKEKKKGGFIRFFCVLLGFCLMAGLQVLEDSSERR